MNIIIDIQGLKDRHGSFVPKEVAVVSAQKEFIGHWIVGPPHKYDELTPSIKRQNTWLLENHHALPWGYGEISLCYMEKVLKNIAVHADRLFTCGAEKTAYLSRITGCFIINLEEEEDLPSFAGLPGSQTFCTHRGLLRKNRTFTSYTCALDHAVRLKNWLTHKDRINDLWEYRTTTCWNVALEGTSGHSVKKSQPPTAAAAATGYEQPSNSGITANHQRSFGWRIPSRSHSEGVDKAYGHCG